MDVRLGDLTEHQDDLDDLLVHLRRDVPTAGHDVQQRRRQWVKQALADEHAAEIILRCRALQLEDAADPVQRVHDELGLLGVVFVEEVDEDFEAAAAVMA